MFLSSINISPKSILLFVVVRSRFRRLLQFRPKHLSPNFLLSWVPSRALRVITCSWCSPSFSPSPIGRFIAEKRCRHHHLLPWRRRVAPLPQPPTDHPEPPDGFPMSSLCPCACLTPWSAVEPPARPGACAAAAPVPLRPRHRHLMDPYPARVPFWSLPATPTPLPSCFVSSLVLPSLALSISL